MRAAILAADAKRAAKTAKAASATADRERKLDADASRDAVINLSDRARASFRFHASDDIPTPRSVEAVNADAASALDALYEASVVTAHCCDPRPAPGSANAYGVDRRSLNPAAGGIDHATFHVEDAQ